MKTFATAAKAAIVAGTARVAGAVEILCTPPVRVWSDNGTIAIGGNSFVGVGGRGLITVTSGAVGSIAEKFTLTLSGVDPDVLALLDAAELKNAAVTVWRLIFDGSGTQLLDAQIFARGRVDRVPTEDVVKGEARIMVEVEGLARGLRRRGGRMRSDADQRLLDTNDGGMKHVSYSGQKTLYWGGKRPASVAHALPGTSPYRDIGRAVRS